MADTVKFAQTRGTFEARGKLFNLKSSNAIKKITTKGGKAMHFLNMGLRIADGESMFLSLSAMEQDKVYFSKPAEKKGEKPTQEIVEWAKRNRFSKDGFRMIGGINYSLAKDGETGKNVATAIMHPFDFIEYVEEHADELEGASVFVRGSIEFSSYAGKEGELKKSTKFVPNAIYLAKDDINFQADDFEKKAEFVQTVVHTAVRREGEKDTAMFFMDGVAVGYRSVEDVSLQITSEGDLAKIMKNKLIPYTAITVNGQITSNQVVEEKETEVWGQRSNIGNARTPSRVTLVITGADPNTMSKESHTEKIINEYREIVAQLNADKNNKAEAFKSQDGGGWGSKSDLKAEKSEDDGDW